MKNFEEPIIIDALDCPEGVYLASGVTPPPINPPTPSGENGWKPWAYWSNHDTGSYSVLSIYAQHHGNGGNSASLTLTYLQAATKPIKEVTCNSLPGGWSMQPYNGGNVLYFTGNHFNGEERIHIKLDMRFDNGEDWKSFGKFAFNPSGSGDQELNEVTGNVDGVFAINIR